jgi:hypothetical protein
MINNDSSPVTKLFNIKEFLLRKFFIVNSFSATLLREFDLEFYIVASLVEQYFHGGTLARRQRVG